MKPSDYINYSYDPFIKKWQDYYYKNIITFEEELTDLQKGLSIESIKEVDNFIQIMLFKLKIPSNQYLIKKNYLYSDVYISKAKKELFSEKEKKEIIKKYNLPNTVHLEIPVFRYHSGLKLLPDYIKKRIYKKNIIDGGAYFGDSSLIFNKYKPNKIYCFEPCSVNFNFLQSTIRNNNLKNIIPINVAISNVERNLNLGFNSFKFPNLGSSIVFNHEAKKQEVVKVTSLDKFVLSNNIKDISLIKLDVEGLELEAIWGAKNIIIENKPILLIAIYHTAEEFLKIKPFLESLNLGYNFIMTTLNHNNILQEFSLIAYVD